MAEGMKGYKDKQKVEHKVSNPAKPKEKTLYYERHIKGGLLTQPQLFVSDGMTSRLDDKVMLYEKAIMRAKCIMDCLVADDNGTVIGLEIKTERDSTQRLKKQLYMYSLVCKYVYVVCHDSFVDKIEKLLKRHKYGYVGIISYIDFKGKPTFGKYKEAELSPNRNPYHTLDILWKKELVAMFNYLRSPSKQGGKVWEMALDKKSEYKKASVNSNLTKPQVITNMINLIGAKGVYRWFSRAMVYGVQNSEKIVDKHIFMSVREDDVNE